MKKKPIRKAPRASADTEALRAFLLAMIQGIGHGGLTEISQALGMTASAMRKRLQRPGGGFDEATMKVMGLVLSTKAQHLLDPQIESTADIGNYRIIRYRTPEGEIRTAWASLEEPDDAPEQ